MGNNFYQAITLAPENSSHHSEVQDAIIVGHRSEVQGAIILGHHSEVQGAIILGHHSEVHGAIILGHHSEVQRAIIVGHHSEAQGAIIVMYVSLLAWRASMCLLVVTPSPRVSCLTTMHLLYCEEAVTVWKTSATRYTGIYSRSLNSKS